MKRTTALYCLATALAVSLAGCSGSSPSPLSPSSITETDAAANADGSTLKVTAPTLVSPINGAKVATRRPTFTFENAAGKYSTAPLSYRIELLDSGGAFVSAGVVNGGEGNTSYIPQTDLALAKDYQWRVRAELEGVPGPYSAVGTFRTPDSASSTPSFSGGGPTGSARSISLNEAYSIIVKVHDELRFNLGSSSSRQSRIDFLWAAVAAVHYGHPRFNPAGGDRGWCVKDGGAGRPPSDDVLVACGSREAWDLVLSAGGNGYRFHLERIGRLDGRQNVYPPPSSALGRLNR